MNYYLILFFLFFYISGLNANFRQTRLLSRIYIENFQYEKAEYLLRAEYENKTDNIGAASDLATIYSLLDYNYKSLSIINRLLEKEKNDFNAMEKKKKVLRKISALAFSDYKKSESGNFYNEIFTIGNDINIKDRGRLKLTAASEKINNTNNISFNYSNFSAGYEMNLNNKSALFFGFNGSNLNSMNLYSPFVKYNANYRGKFNFSFSCNGKKNWNNPVYAAFLNGTFDDINFEFNGNIMKNLLFTCVLEKKNYYINKKNKYGNADEYFFSFSRYFSFNDIEENYMNNFFSMSLNYFYQKNCLQDLYKTEISLAERVNQFSLNALAGKRLNKYCLLEAGSFLSYDKKRNIDIFEGYGFNVKLSGYLTSRMIFSSRFEYNSETDNYQKGSSRVFDVNCNYYF